MSSMIPKKKNTAPYSIQSYVLICVSHGSPHGKTGSVPPLKLKILESRVSSNVSFCFEEVAFVPCPRKPTLLIMPMKKTKRLVTKEYVTLKPKS